MRAGFIVTSFHEVSNVHALREELGMFIPDIIHVSTFKQHMKLILHIKGCVVAPSARALAERPVQLRIHPYWCITESETCSCTFDAV